LLQRLLQKAAQERRSDFVQRTLIILKPDCMKNGLCGTVLQRLENAGLTIVAAKMVKLTPEILDEHYSHLKQKPFFPSLVEFMMSSPVIMAILEGENAVEKVRKLCGITDSTKAGKGTIRGDFGKSVQSNIIHASDSGETAEKEIDRFFKADEIFSYKREK